MSDQSETTANTPKQPQPCKMGCGFFGSNATGDCCSKCWREKLEREGKMIEKEVKEITPTVSSVASTPASSTPASIATPMDVLPNKSSMDGKKAGSGGKPKKKKKKASYKAMMAGIVQGNPQRDIQQEKEKLRDVTGGGTFSKIDKI